MAFVRITDIKEADKLWEAGLLWWDAYGPTWPCRNRRDGRLESNYYRPSAYAKRGSVPNPGYYILLED